MVSFLVKHVISSSKASFFFLFKIQTNRHYHERLGTCTTYLKRYAKTDFCMNHALKWLWWTIVLSIIPEFILSMLLCNLRIDMSLFELYSLLEIYLLGEHISLPPFNKHCNNRKFVMINVIA